MLLVGVLQKILLIDSVSFCLLFSWISKHVSFLAWLLIFSRGFAGLLTHDVSRFFFSNTMPRMSPASILSAALLFSQVREDLFAFRAPRLLLESSPL